MLDIKLLRENPGLVKESLKKRKDTEKLEWLDDLIKKDKEYKEVMQKVQDLRHKRNTASKEINELKKQGKDISSFIKEVLFSSPCTVQTEMDKVCMKWFT